VNISEKRVKVQRGLSLRVGLSFQRLSSTSGGNDTRLYTRGKNNKSNLISRVKVASVPTIEMCIQREILHQACARIERFRLEVLIQSKFVKVNIVGDLHMVNLLKR